MLSSPFDLIVSDQDFQSSLGIHKITDRFENWLWVFMKNHRVHATTDRPPKMHRKIFIDALHNNQELRRKFDEICKITFVHDFYLEWIVNDPLQLEWIEKKLGVNHLRSDIVYFHNNLSHKEKIITLIDNLNQPLTEKIHAIEQLKMDWGKYLRRAKVLDWLDGHPSSERVKFSWDWLLKYYSEIFSSIYQPTNSHDLKYLIKTKIASPEEKELIIHSIKSAWSNHIYRKKISKSKKQCNVYLPIEIIAKLDKIAKNNSASRGEIIEILIDEESKTNIHLETRKRRREALGLPSLNNYESPITNLERQDIPKKTSQPQNWNIRSSAPLSVYEYKYQNIANIHESPQPHKDTVDFESEVLSDKNTEPIKRREPKVEVGRKKRK